MLQNTQELPMVIQFDSIWPWWWPAQMQSTNKFKYIWMWTVWSAPRVLFRPGKRLTVKLYKVPLEIPSVFKFIYSLLINWHDTKWAFIRTKIHKMDKMTKLSWGVWKWWIYRELTSLLFVFYFLKILSALTVSFSVEEATVPCIKNLCNLSVSLGLQHRLGSY